MRTGRLPTVHVLVAATRCQQQGSEYPPLGTHAKVPTPSPEGTWDTHPYIPWTDRRSWKHYLPATSLAGRYERQIRAVHAFDFFGEGGGQTNT